MKNITIIGASAGVGLETVTKSLADGHHVTSLSRSIENLPQHPNLTIVQGSATDGADVQKAITGADAIIVTIEKNVKGGDIARADVADFLVRQAVHPTEIGHYVVLMGD